MKLVSQEIESLLEIEYWTPKEGRSEIPYPREVKNLAVIISVLSGILISK